MANTTVPAELSSTPSISDSGDATAITIDSEERIIIGHTAALDDIRATDPYLQVLGSGLDTAHIGIIRFSNSVNGGHLSIGKSRSGTVGTNTIVQDGDKIGSLNFVGGDGSDYHEGAVIEAVISGTPGTGDMPTALTFQTTADGATSSTEAMRITPDNKVGIGKTDPNYPLVVAGTNPKIQIYDSDGSGQTNLYFGDSGSNLAGYVIYQHSDNKMRFGTDATDRMIIQSDGGVMFNTSTALGQTTSLAGTNTNNWCGKTTTDTYSNFLGFASGGNITYYVTGQGNYFYNGSAVSDRDLKENIESITESSLAKVKLLEPKTFNFKADDNFGTNKKTGFIAQEVAAIFGTTDGVATGTDGQKDMGIDPTGLIAHLTKAIQEQQVIIEDLKTRITTLESS